VARVFRKERSGEKEEREKGEKRERGIGIKPIPL
jgi:hypothetical protein